jgi:hypothetical protein
VGASTIRRVLQRLRIPPPRSVADSGYERIKCRPVLGGLINEYERVA